MAARPPRSPSPDRPRTGAAKTSRSPKPNRGAGDLTTALLAAVVGAAHDAILICDAQERVVVFNQAAERMFGCSAADAIGGPVARFVPERLRADHSRRLRGLAAAGIEWSPSGRHAQVLGLRVDGTEIPLEAALSVVVVGGRTYFAVIHRDLRERLAAESAVRERLELQGRLTELSAVAPGVMFSYEIGPDGSQRFTFLSDGVRALVGLSSQEVLSAPGGYFGFVHPDDLAATLGSIEAAARGSSPWRAEFRVRHTGGDWVWLEGRSAAEPPRADGTLVFHGFLSDISERKRAEAALVASERRYRGLFRAMVEGCAYCRMIFEDGRPVDYLHLDVNPAFEELTGLHGTAGRRVTELIPGILEANPELFEAYGRVVATGVPDRFETYVPGLERWYSVSAFRPEAGCFVAVFENITERKHFEAQLRHQEALLRESGEIARVGGWEFDPATGKGSWTAETARIHGVDPALPVDARRGLSFYSGESRRRIEAAVAEALRSGAPYDLELELTAADGTLKWVRMICRPEVLEGRVARMRGSFQDITERKRAEAALRANEERLRLALEGAKQGLFDLDVQTDETVVSPEYALMLGYDPDEFRETNAAWIERMHPDDRPAASAAYLDCIAGRTPEYRVEFRQRTKSGEWKWILSLGRVVERDPEGKPLRMLGTHTDITERRRAEESLADERLRLRTVLDTIPDLVWLKDPEGRFLACNPAFERLMGASEKELVGRTDYDFLDRAQADFFRSRDRDAASAGRSLMNEESVTFAADGHRALIETIKTPVRDHRGELLGVLGVARDVTEVRRTAEALRRSEERLRLFIEQAPAALAMFDRDMRYLSASRRWRSDFGLGDGDLTGRLHYEASPEVRDDWKEVHRRGLAGEVVRAEEDRFVRPNGEVQWLRWEVRPWRDDSGAVAGIVIFTEDITDRKATLAALAESEAHYRALTETTFDWIWEVDAEGRYTFASPRVSDLLGYAPEEVLGRTPFDLMPEEEGRRMRAEFEGIAVRREPFSALQGVHRHRDGRLVVLESSGVPVSGPDGELRGYRGMDRDVTQRIRLEEQLRSAQKLEAIGRLAGGVAHDFNNLLTVISGNGELLAQALGPDGHQRMLVGEIRDAAERAAVLTRQLLAFSRSQVLAPQVFELNAAIRRVESMLRRLIGEDVELECVLAPEVGCVRVDPGQLEQTIVNLAVNARDAMPRGGRLRLETRAAALGAAFCREHPGSAPGRYALLAVRDTGAGMTPEVRERLFEPFFTTKAQGAGTGLGLATVHGIVAQSGGFIEVESELGRGSCFTIYLPSVAAVAAAAETPAARPAPTPGRETILLVEDEEGVRRIARIALERRGYRVFGAANGRAALAVADVHGEAIDLLVTDLVMPGLSGRELADELRARRPELRVLYVSGYVEDALARHGIVEEEVAFLHKPFSLDELADKVRAVLDGADGKDPAEPLLR